MTNVKLYMAVRGCESVPYGTKIADVVNGVQYNSIAINPSFDRFEEASDFIRRSPERTVTGRELIGML